MISWVVPTVDGREETLRRSLSPIKDRVEVIVVANPVTCGEGWVDGARIANGDYICLSADDLEPHDGYVEAMIEAVDQGKHPAALVLEPNGSKQSCGGAGGDVCRGDCPDWQPVEWSPTPFINADWWNLIEPHADMLAGLHYSSDCLISAILAKAGVPSVMRREAVITHYNSPIGRLSTASSDGTLFHQYRTANAL